MRQSFFCLCEQVTLLNVVVSKTTGRVTNGVDPDQLPRLSVSGLDLHCLTVRILNVNTVYIRTVIYWTNGMSVIRN